jgi:uncharacterized membrane protein/YHS domain-containing protein
VESAIRMTGITLLERLGTDRRTAEFLAWCFVALLTVGAAAQQPATRPAINQFCPVQTDQKADPSITTVYQGHTIAFCCTRCRKKFEANPEKYVSNLSLPEQQADETLPGSSGQAALLDEDHGRQADERADERESHPVYVEQGAHRNGPAGVDKLTEGNTDHEHEHEAAEAATTLGRLIAWLGRFHPPMVNFPIAMLVGAAIAELLRMATRRPSFANAGRFCLWVGGLGALAAGALGWFFAGFRLSDSSWIMTTHRWMGTATVVLSIMTLIVGERAYRKGGPFAVYRLLFLTVAVGVMVTGFFGGAMIYGIDHYPW